MDQEGTNRELNWIKNLDPNDLAFHHRGPRVKSEDCSTRLYHRRQVHQSCEIRRRNAILSGLNELRAVLGVQSLSKVDVMLATVRQIEQLSKSIKKLQAEQERLMNENLELMVSKQMIQTKAEKEKKKMYRQVLPEIPMKFKPRGIRSNRRYMF